MEDKLNNELFLMDEIQLSEIVGGNCDSNTPDTTLTKKILDVLEFQGILTPINQ